MAAEALEQSVLESKDKDQLLAIAKALGLKASARTKKSDIIDQILETTGSPTARANGAPVVPAPRDSRTSSGNGDVPAVGGATGRGRRRPRPSPSTPSRPPSGSSSSAPATTARHRRVADTAVSTATSPAATTRLPPPTRVSSAGPPTPRVAAAGDAGAPDRRRPGRPEATRTRAEASPRVPRRGGREPQPPAAPPPQGRRPGGRGTAGRRRHRARRATARPSPTSRSRCRATSTCATRATASCG